MSGDQAGCLSETLFFVCDIMLSVKMLECGFERTVHKLLEFVL